MVSKALFQKVAQSVVRGILKFESSRISLGRNYLTHSPSHKAKSHEGVQISSRLVPRAI
jgi:hypothetical protein